MFKKRKKDSSLIGAVQNYYLICNTLLLLVFGICMLGISTRVLINKVEDSSEMITEQAVYTLDKTFNDIASQMVTVIFGTNSVNPICPFRINWM